MGTFVGTERNRNCGCGFPSLYSQTRGPLIHGTDQIHTLFYGTDRTMNAEFKRMRQVCCHIGMESVTSARDGSAWVRLVDIKRRVIQVHEYS